MDASTTAFEGAIEEHHWWFVGRRRLLARMIAQLGVDPDAAVLDVGSGAGTTLRLLGELGFGSVTGLDRSEEAIRQCRAKGLGPLRRGDAQALPFAAGRFDLAIAADVFEHVDDEAGAMSELHRVLRPGGLAIVTVPAFPSLWGLQDEVSHHRRRYRRKELVSRMESADFEILQSFYFNYLLFGPIWLARRALRLLRPRLASENQINTPLLNALLARLFAFDVWSAPRLRPAFGVSILAVARRPRP